MDIHLRSIAIMLASIPACFAWGCRDSSELIEDGEGDADGSADTGGDADARPDQAGDPVADAADESGEGEGDAPSPPLDNLCAPSETEEIACGPENTRYVAVTGDDGGAGTHDQPWRTINHAIEQTVPGDCVYVRGGEYEEGGEIWIRDGSGGADGAWWSLEPYPGEEVTLLTRVIVDGSHVRVRGFNFASGTGLITAWTGAHKEILDNHFTGYYVYAPLDVGFDYCLAEGNVIELDGTGETTDHGIYVMHGSHNIIRNNTIRSPHGYGIHVYDEDKYEHSPDISDVLVECNFITSSVERSGIIVANSANVNIDGIVIRRNVVVGNPGFGIVVYSDGPSVQNVSILHNTIVGNGEGAVSIGDMTGVMVRNNIFVWDGAPVVVGVSGSSGIAVETNLYWPESPTLSGVTDPDMVIGDPMFADEAAGDYHLREGSPAIDAGMDLGLPFEGAAPDLGAFEFAAP